MHDTLRCPGCKAELALPALASGQTVQCPRCRETVDPARPFHTALKARPSAAMPALGESVPLDDHLPDDLRTLIRPDPLRGEWLCYLANALLSISVLSFLIQVGVAWQFVKLSALEMERDAKLHTNIAVADHREDLERIRNELNVRHGEWKRLEQGATIADRASFWAAAGAFLAWLYFASHNLKALKAFGASHHPATALLSFFVPILNFYRPYVIVQEIWQGSDPDAIANKFAWFDAPLSSVVRYWWTLFVMGEVVLWLTGFLACSHNWNQANSTAWLVCLANLLLVSAGVLLIIVVHRITARQRRRWDRLYSDS